MAVNIVLVLSRDKIDCFESSSRTIIKFWLLILYKCYSHDSTRTRTCSSLVQNASDSISFFYNNRVASLVIDYDLVEKKNNSWPQKYNMKDIELFKN